mmetsp:Transcript_22411/g.39404  ORF Transcript_22411/g.39404 Transcript_22411/m.39404 type:complete len:405 (+) Transcript_22411:133-1347(+)
MNPPRRISFISPRRLLLTIWIIVIMIATMIAVHSRRLVVLGHLTLLIVCIYYFITRKNVHLYAHNQNSDTMGKRPQRDPGAPKRNMSAYLLYQNAMREQFKALNPGMTFGQLAKYTSAMYSELPPAEKEAWIARAEADKARYLHELASYNPPPGYDPKGDAIISPVTSKNGRKGKPEKDANAPKRNLSAYLLYQNAMREQFKRENPGMTFGQLAKYTSHMYKNLTPEEKATWEARAAQDKARYDSEIASYVPPPGHDARGVLIEDHRPRKRNKRGPKDPSAPKRASGAYVFFTNEMRPKVLSEYPGIKFVELGKVLGERWRALTPEQKKRYEDMANVDKLRFQNEMQQYTANQAAAAPPQPQVSANQDHYAYHDPTDASAYEPYGQHHHVHHHDPYTQAQYHTA